MSKRRSKCRRSAKQKAAKAHRTLGRQKNFEPQQWNPIFSTHRTDVKHAEENKRFVDTREREQDLSEGIIKCFMKDPEDSEACLPRVEKVEQYCGSVSLDMVQTGNRTDNKSWPTTAWIDERSGVREDERQRSRQGPLTAPMLYQLLLKPRFLVHENRPGCPDGDIIEPDAERRKIYITDLDAWSIFALIGTVSENQSIGLRDAIYKHLAFKHFIGVTFPRGGLQMFHLIFHIPFCVFRSSATANEDHRRDMNAMPLRHCRDVSYLNWRNTETSSFLYEAQYSCLVAGSDETHWSAYGFIDTYFEAPGDAKETVDDYHEQSLGDTGLYVDPLTFGNTQVDNAVASARRYFLCVLENRLAQIKTQWMQVVSKVLDSVREYEQMHSDSFSFSREQPETPEARREYDLKVTRARDWVISVQRLTAKLVQVLSSTVDSFEKFFSGHAGYFDDLPDDSQGARPLAGIRVSYEELQFLQKELNCANDSCKTFAKELKMHDIGESRQTGALQHKLAQENRILTCLVLILSPFALAATMLSMSDRVISFMPATFGSFLGLSLVVSMLTYLLYALLQYEKQVWDIFLALAGQLSWKATKARRASKHDP